MSEKAERYGTSPNLNEQLTIKERSSSASSEIQTKNTNRLIMVTLMFLICILATGTIIYFVIINNKENPDLSSQEPIYIEPSSGNHTHTIIFMHGLNNNPENFIEMFNKSLYIKNKNTTKIVLLRAPKMKLTYSEGVKETSWFDILKFPIDSANTYNFENAKNSASYLKTMIKKEAELLNGEKNKIYIGGHGQGASVSLYTGYTEEDLLGGVIVFSGILFPQADILSYNESLPVFLAHGDQDRAIPFQFHLETVKNITNFERVKKFYYEGQGHSISEQEIIDMSGFLNETMI